MGQRTKQTFLQRRHTNGYHMKIRSISVIIREIQIKTTVRNHFMAVRMAAIQKPTSNKSQRGYGEKGTLLHCWWECKLSLLFKTLSHFDIDILPRSQHILILWLQSLILELKSMKSDTVPTLCQSICHEKIGSDAMILVF